MLDTRKIRLLFLRQRSDTVCGNSRMPRLWIVINSNVANAIKCNMRSLDNYLFKDKNSCTNKTMSSLYFRTLDTYLIHYHNLVYIPRFQIDVICIQTWNLRHSSTVKPNTKRYPPTKSESSWDLRRSWHIIFFRQSYESRTTFFMNLIYF